MTQPQPEHFRQSVESGLLLPPELSRKREVLSRDEWRLIERFTKMIHAHGLTFQMRCEKKTCIGKPLTPSRLADGSFQLQCECTDRVMVDHTFASQPKKPFGFERSHIRRVKLPSRKHRG